MKKLQQYINEGESKYLTQLDLCTITIHVTCLLQKSEIAELNNMYKEYYEKAKEEENLYDFELWMERFDNNLFGDDRERWTKGKIGSFCSILIDFLEWVDNNILKQKDTIDKKEIALIISKLK